MSTQDSTDGLDVVAALPRSGDSVRYVRVDEYLGAIRAELLAGDRPVVPGARVHNVHRGAGTVLLPSSKPPTPDYVLVRWDDGRRSWINLADVTGTAR